MILGINHTTLSVRNLEEAFVFYADILGLKTLAKRKNRSAYFLAGEDWIALVQEDKLSVAANAATYAHVAFTVKEQDFLALSKRIQESGAEIWQENSSPGSSLYFLDPSGNRLEIHAGTWKTRLEWLKENPLPDVEIFV